jgi:hypothetical protein
MFQHGDRRLDNVEDMSHLRLVEPRYVITRAGLIDALTRLEVRPAVAHGQPFVVAEDVADALLEMLREDMTNTSAEHRGAILRTGRDLLLLRGFLYESQESVGDALLAAAERLRLLANDL